MSETSLEFFSGVLLVSENPERLATFYRDVLDLPLEEERHGDTLPHWGCNVGDIHFAIHPIDDFPEDRKSGVGAVKLAFNVFDVRALAAKLEARGAELLHPPKDTGFFVSAAILDPDGNFIELTELVDEWFEMLEERRKKGLDIVDRWKGREGPLSRIVPALLVAERSYRVNTRGTLGRNETGKQRNDRLVSSN